MRRLTAQHRLRAVLGAAALLCLLPGAAPGHWIKPEEIAAGLNRNQELTKNAGLVRARIDPELPRLLVIEVRGETWQALPSQQRLFLAQTWHDDWRHNVDGGIVGIVDEKTQKPLVNYDSSGTARLVGKSP